MDFVKSSTNRKRMRTAVKKYKSGSKRPKARIHSKFLTSKEFCDSCFKFQNWAFPKPIITYIMENQNSKVYQKLIQSCKYFFFKNPVLVISSLHTFNGCCNLSKAKPEMSNVMAKIWLVGRISVDYNFPSPIISKFYRCDAKHLMLTNLKISYYDLSQIIQSAETIQFQRYFIIKTEDGSNVSLEKIVEISVKAKEIYIDSETILSCITSKTMKELLKISTFSKLTYLFINHIPEAFDLVTFNYYMKFYNV